MSIVRLGRRVSKVIEDGNFNSSDSGCERREKVRRDKAEKGTFSFFGRAPAKGARRSR